MLSLGDIISVGVLHMSLVYLKMQQIFITISYSNKKRQFLNAVASNNSTSDNNS